MQQVLRSELLRRHGFSHGFSLRAGGVSLAPYDSLNLGGAVGDDPACVAENRRRIAESVGYAPDRLFEVSQVHGRGVRQVRASEAPFSVRLEEADALASSEHGVVVGVRVADCLPLVLVDPETRAVAVVHAGWRGTTLGVAAAALRVLCEATSAPVERLHAAVFPHIRSCCFEVGPDVAEQIVEASPDKSAIDASRGRPYVQLAAVIGSQLVALGVPALQIDDVPGCTCCDAQRFFSYRRDGKRSGRHLLAVIAG